MFFGVWIVGTLLAFPVLESHLWWVPAIPGVWAATALVLALQRRHLDLLAGLGVATFGLFVALNYALSGHPSPYTLALVPVAAIIMAAPGGVVLWSAVTLAAAAFVVVYEMGAVPALGDPGIAGQWEAAESFAFLSIVALSSLCMGAAQHLQRNLERRNVDHARRFQTVAEGTYDGILEFETVRGNPFRGIRYSNVQTAALLGYDIEDFRGQTIDFHDWVHAEDRTIVQQFVVDSYADPGVRRCRFRARHRDGRWIWLEATQFRAYRHEGTGRIRRVVTLRDVSDEQREQDRRIETQRLEGLGVLAGGVAHDFNNLLTVIIGYAEDIEDPEARREVERATQQARDLTARLLAVGRKQPRTPELFELGERIRDNRRMVTSVVGETIAVDFRLGPGSVDADPRQLEQVLLNLVTNARDAMPGGGRLQIETSVVPVDAAMAQRLDLPAGDFVRLRVRDDGVGMDPETLERALDPFFSTKERHAGTGLGLSSVQGIVEQSRGHIRIESRIAEGTQVDVYLPVATRDPAQVGDFAALGSPRAPARGNGERILLVEDDAPLRALVSRRLGELNYQAAATSSPRDALEQLETSPQNFDLLISDIVLPEMRGTELAQQVRKIRDVPVLLISGYSDDETRGPTDAVPGAIEFLAKPFSTDELADRIGRLLHTGGASVPTSP